MNEKVFALAFDFGGTKLAAALINTNTGELEDYLICPTPQPKTAVNSLSAMEKLGRQLITNNGNNSPFRIGISFGGSIDQDRKTVKRSVHVNGWDHFPIVDYFYRRFSIPVFLENDANAAALGEWAFGAGDQVESMLYIQLSTGIGAGLVITGQIWRGEGYAGEFGHVKSHECKDYCVCGQKGCLESAFAGWAIQKAGQELVRTNPSDSLLGQLCENDILKIDARLVFEAMRRGDTGSTRIIHNGVDKLGTALSNAINLLDPSKVILGGSICKSKSLFSARLDDILKTHVINSIYSHSQFGFASLAGKETLIGAAMLDK